MIEINQTLENNMDLFLLVDDVLDIPIEVPSVLDTPTYKAKKNDNSTSDDNITSGRWTSQEHQIFLEGLKTHGKGWKKIAAMIVTRNVIQVRTHAQKYFQRLERNKLNSQTETYSEQEDIKSISPTNKRKKASIKESNQDDDKTTILKKTRTEKNVNKNEKLNKNSIKINSKDFPDETTSENLFSLSMIDQVSSNGNKSIWITKAFMGDWFENCSTSTFNSTTSAGSSLCGEEDFDDTESSNNCIDSFFDAIPEHPTDQLILENELFDDTIDEETFVSGILEMFDI